MRLHGRIAQVLEKLCGAQAEAHANELAYHFSEAQALLGHEKLVRYSLLAGERALTIYAWEEALRHFQRGLEAKEGHPSWTDSRPGLDAETAALLFGLGRAQAATLERHQLGEAVDSLSQALGYYAEVGDVVRAVAIVESAPTSRPASGLGWLSL